MKDVEKLSQLHRSQPLIEEALVYMFQDKELLTQAFTHSSFLNECHIPLISNERLEFLGDSVLNLYVSSFLFNAFPFLDEGILSKHKATLISRQSCTLMMKELNVAEHILIANNDLTHLSSTSILANLFEAILGAIFLDGGWESVQHFLHTRFSHFFLTLIENASPNPKAALQEYLAKHHLPPPEYRLESVEGPPHSRIFTIVAVSNKAELGKASGRTKREAENEAATIALTTLTNYST